MSKVIAKKKSAIYYCRQVDNLSNYSIILKVTCEWAFFLCDGKTILITFQTISESENDPCISDFENSMRIATVKILTWPWDVILFPKSDCYFVLSFENNDFDLKQENK